MQSRKRVAVDFDRCESQLFVEIPVVESIDTIICELLVRLVENVQEPACNPPFRPAGIVLICWGNMAEDVLLRDFLLALTDFGCCRLTLQQSKISGRKTHSATFE